MKSRLTLSIFASGCFSLAACGSFQSGKPAQDKTKKPAATSTAPRLVGKVASIPADKRFVLIQSFGKWNIETGSILTSRGADERTANLLATGESLGEFAAADVQSGTVEVGDGVYSRHVPKPLPPTETPRTPESQQIPLPENVQKNN